MSQELKSIHARVSRQRVFLSLLEIFMVIVAIIFIYPAVFVLISAFKPDKAIVMTPMTLPSSLFLNNFVVAWKNTLESVPGLPFPVPASLLNTLYITVVGVLGIVFFASMCAYMLARSANLLSKILYLLFAFALVIPFQVIMIPLVVHTSDSGLDRVHFFGTVISASQFIGTFIPGFTQNLPQGLVNFLEWLKFYMPVWGIVVAYWGLGMPTAVFMYHGFVKGVPKELEESAAIDGAGQYYTYFKIVFPMLKPITATIVVLNALWLWNDFLFPNIAMNSGKTLQVAQLALQGEFVNRYGPLTASLVITATPIIALYLALQKYIIKGIAAGAVKG